jgi:predicted TPR repeat methyltransferase
MSVKNKSIKSTKSPKSPKSAKSPKPPFDEEREITLGESIDMVRHMLAGKQFSQAEYMLTTILAALPEQPDALPLLGALRNIQGRHDEALELMLKSIKLAPDDARRWNDLGLVYGRLNRREDAAAAFLKSAELGGHTSVGANALDNLGRQQMRDDDPVAAEQTFRRATEMAPTEGIPWYGLSQALIKMDRIAEGVDACGQSIVLMPQHAPREHTIRALIHLGRNDEAIEKYHEWIKEEPDNPVLKHHLAALMNPDTPERASDAYVEKVFDSFSASFDETLALLDYHAPDLIAEAFAGVYAEQKASLDIADAGCGTGLCGPLVAPWARRLSGFDLSGGMLKKAEDRKVYTDLHKAELVSFLQARPAEFDAIVCADTLCYFANLNEMMLASHSSVRPGGHIFYTVELTEDDAHPHRLLPSGRYAHSLAHVSASATSAGLHVLRVNRVKLRSEAGRPVLGWLVVLHRS